MRTVPPHPLIRYRHALLVLALAGWMVAGVTLIQFKGDAIVPIGTVVGLAGLVFIWANGVYWWVIFRYPYIDMGDGKFVSRDEWKGTSHGTFLIGYFLLAVFVSIACLRVALNG
jgi:hypothetical protein